MRNKQFTQQTYCGEKGKVNHRQTKSQKKKTKSLSERQWPLEIYIWLGRETTYKK